MTSAWIGSANRAAAATQRGAAVPIAQRRAARKPDASSASRSRKPTSSAGAPGSMPMIAFSERRYLLDDANRTTRNGAAASSTRLLGRIRFRLTCSPHARSRILGPARGSSGGSGGSSGSGGTAGSAGPGPSVAPVLGDQLVEGAIFLDGGEALVERVDHRFAFLEHDAERIGLQAGNPDGEFAREFLLVGQPPRCRRSPRRPRRRSATPGWLPRTRHTGSRCRAPPTPPPTGHWWSRSARPVSARPS